MEARKALAIFFLLAVAGMGLSAYMAESNVSVSVADKEVRISPESTSVSTHADDYTAKNLTISTSSDKTVTVRLKVLPADYATARVWGKYFVAFVSPNSVKVNSTHSVKVTLIAHSEKPGNYRVKVVAVE